MKSLLQRFLAIFGYEINRLSLTGQKRTTLEIALSVARQNGLQVKTIIDTGAAFGDWTRISRNLFPQAHSVLVEPLPHYDKWLDELIEELPNVTRVKAAASARLGQSKFFLHKDWVGSSLYAEAEGTMVDGQAIKVETVTIDDLVQQQKLPGPFLLKIDVQGAELQVLEGASHTLQQTEYLLVETSLFQFFKDGPLMHDLIIYMLKQGFVIYDILGLQYRLLDNALGQVDLVFVPEQSLLRKEHVYASLAQRTEQNQRFQRDLKLE